MLIEKENLQQVANEVMNMQNEEEITNLNNLYAAVVEGDIDKIDELFRIHVASVEANFKSEEDMMQEANYPQLAQHKRDHDLIVKKLQKFLKRWEVLKGPNEVRGFLEKDAKKWWLNHISKFDAQTALKLGHAEEY